MISAPSSSSALEWAEETGKDWEPYWKDEDSRLIHFIGKDNIVFHCIIFPSMLKQEGSYILPDNVCKRNLGVGQAGSESHQ